MHMSRLIRVSNEFYDYLILRKERIEGSTGFDTTFEDIIKSEMNGRKTQAEQRADEVVFPNLFKRKLHGRRS